MTIENKMISGVIEVDVSNLTLAVWNYKTDDARLLKKLENNIKKHGQVENLIVRELPSEDGESVYEVVNGNHRVKALVSLGFDKAVCFNLGVISDAQAKRIAVETNETKFGTDSIKLAEVMRDIREEYDIDEILETMPYSRGEMDNFSGMLDFDWSQFNSSGSDGYEDIVKKDVDEPVQTDVSTRLMVECPNCKHSFEVTA